jgi:transcriptional regulator with XRE-family HTH domain
MKKEVYNRLKEVLDEQSVQQTELADRLNTSKSAINSMCGNTRQPYLKKLFEIASALNVPAYTLIGDYNPETIKQELALQMLSDFIDKDIIDDIKEKINRKQP